MSKTSKSANIIGAGIGGLATAVRLARRGYAVRVFEANAIAGGKATKIEQDGFFWGFGPSLFTLPELLDELFALCGRDATQYYRYKRIDPVCKYFYEDGTRLQAHAQPEAFAEELQQKTGEPARNVLRHLKKIAADYEATKRIFLYSSLHKAATYFNLRALKTMTHLPQLGMTNTMHRANQHQFKDERVVQLFNRYATYNGSDPYLAPATLNVIAHLEYNMGAYFLEGGMPDLSAALYKLAIELGVQFHFNTKVERIFAEDNVATGVVANGNFYASDVVVSNMDVHYTYKKLMPAAKAPEQILQQPKSTSGLIFYWGINRSFPELDLHNIFFSGNYAEEFRHLTHLKTIYSDPTVYVFISKKYQPGHAPDGCENWFVLINAPSDSGQNWSELIASTRKNVIGKLNRLLNTNLEKHIVTETINSPVTIQQKTMSYAGALYGSASNNMMSAFLRQPNFSRKVKNLYFCGGSVHPGGGVPLCLLSAKIVDELIA